jgi:hypothetical protein
MVIIPDTGIKCKVGAQANGRWYRKVCNVEESTHFRPLSEGELGKVIGRFITNNNHQVSLITPRCARTAHDNHAVVEGFLRCVDTTPSPRSARTDSNFPKGPIIAAHLG